MITSKFLILDTKSGKTFLTLLAVKAVIYLRRVRCCICQSSSFLPHDVVVDNARLLLELPNQLVVVFFQEFHLLSSLGCSPLKSDDAIHQELLCDQWVVQGRQVVLDERASLVKVEGLASKVVMSYINEVCRKIGREKKCYDFQFPTQEVGSTQFTGLVSY